MEWVNLILSNLTGIAAVITLVITLVKYVQKAVKEKNWPQVVQMVSNYMERAETMFESGVDRKEWVLAMVKSSADTVKYEIDMDEIGRLIDSLCTMSKVVNAPAEEEKVG